MKNLLTKTFVAALLLTGLAVQAQAGECLYRAERETRMYPEYNDAQIALRGVIVASKYVRCLTSARKGAMLTADVEESAVQALRVIRRYASYSTPVRQALENLDRSTDRLQMYLDEQVNSGEIELSEAAAYLGDKVYHLRATL